jgi:hypothetical protein
MLSECDINVLLMDLNELRRALEIEPGTYSLGRHTAWEDIQLGKT